jgi:hypothetical protein
MPTRFIMKMASLFIFINNEDDEIYFSINSYEFSFQNIILIGLIVLIHFIQRLSNEVKYIKK